MSFSLLAQAASQPAGSEGALLWGFVLLGVAIVLFAIELFVPSGGLIAIVAGIAVVSSIVEFFQYDTTWGLVALGAYLVAGPMLFAFGFRVWLHSPLAKRVILGGPELDEDDEEGPVPPSSGRSESVRMALAGLVGAQGVAVTALRPVGTVKINGERVDALAEAGIIDSGTPVVVTEVVDRQIKVRPL
ncbi:MAG TPA: NfeD family protein [Phycisphaerales bacterium]|nr:NfeD family protein [Phycisphaerales bacterium]